jgi:transcriptional regulator with PAS, ATPase and Fis domain
VVVNCAAIPAQLFESEVFGYCKGAFTGATSNKRGLFERAHQGTLVLDEVGELIPELQAKLLRVLDSGEYTPVGGHRVKHADVRILAATNRDINELLHSGVMRRDFFHRLHVIAIQAPPLRKRLEDLPLLIEHILKKRVPDHLPLPPEVLSELYAHPWPGNVRELQNVIVRYAATQELTFSHGRPVPPTTRQSGMHAVHAIIQERQTLRNALKAFEKQYILMTLERHNWHKTKTAAALGIPGRTFRDKLKSHGISGPPSS